MNKLIIITAPSGSGKTSLTRYLLQQFPQLSFSVSATTRKPRPNEQNGTDYFFMSVPEFQQKIENNEFLEWEMVYENVYYGTLTKEIEKLWHQQKTPVLDIDVKGALNIQQKNAAQTLSIFVQAPSIEILEQRLRSRGTETEETIAKRIQKADYELSFKNNFDVIIVNDNLQQAQQQIVGVVEQFLLT